YGIVGIKLKSTRELPFCFSCLLVCHRCRSFVDSPSRFRRGSQCIGSDELWPKCSVWLRSMGMIVFNRALPKCARAKQQDGESETKAIRGSFCESCRLSA